MNEIIREIENKDRKKCLEIFVACLRKVNSNYYTPNFIKYIIKRYKKMFVKRPEVKTYVIEKDRTIIATGSISTEGQIRDIFVDVQNHKKGYGKKLMEKLENEAKLNKINNLFLYSSLSAVNFYEKIGYTKKIN